MTDSDGRRILIVAGEASGDLHGANLIRAARDLDPGLCFFGMGGEKMAAAGCDIRVDIRQLAVMGLFEVVTKLPQIRRAFRQLKGLLSGPQRPDLVVLVDYPGFNLRFAAAARKAGVPVLYYICPKIWASRPGRISKIVRDVDRLAVIFPFETELFRELPLAVDYVGNPLLDEYHLPEARESVLRRHGLDPARPVVGLFPGSRRSEIRHILATVLDTAVILQQQYPELQFLVPLAPGREAEEIARPLRERSLQAELVRDDIYDLAGACDIILSVSGTVTLQVALAGTPMAILYKASALTYAIAKRLVRIPHVGLPNIVAGREIVREFIQEAARPEALAAELQRLLDDQQYRARVEHDLAEVKSRLGEPGCSVKVAGIIQEMVK